MTAVRATVCVFLCLSLAGCGSVVPGGEAAPETTYAPPEETDVLPYPPGADGDGVADPNALAEAHAEVVENRGIHTRERVLVYENDSDTLHSSRAVETWFGPDRSTYRVDATLRGARRPVANASDRRISRYDLWGDDDRVYRFRRVGFESRYERIVTRSDEPIAPQAFADYAATPDPAVPELIVRAFAGVAIGTVTELNESDGVERYRYEGTTLANRDVLRYDERQRIGNVSLTAVVDERGLVHELELSYELLRGNTTLRVHHEYEVVARGSVDPPRPGWMARAPADDRAVYVPSDESLPWQEGRALAICRSNGDARTCPQ